MSELGNKHECLGCSTKFYDLGRSDLICPQCGENQKDLAAAQEGSTGGKKPGKKKAAKKKPAKKKPAKKKAAKAGDGKEPDKESADAAKKD